MSGFIAPDEEVERELAEEQRQKMKKKRKSGKVRKLKQLDDDDFDIIRENVGIEIRKKSRLKKTAIVEAEREAAIKVEKKEERSESETEAPLIDSKTKGRMEVDYQKVEDKREPQLGGRSHIDPDRLRQAHDIFGTGEDDAPIKKVDESKEHAMID